MQATARDDDIGITTATITRMRSVGQAFGVAIGGAVIYGSQAAHKGIIRHSLLVSGPAPSVNRS